MQSNSRGVDVSFTTIDKLLQDAARPAPSSSIGRPRGEEPTRAVQ
jgi:hypothetical protein